jgi:hypothetical protein
VSAFSDVFFHFFFVEISIVAQKFASTCFDEMLSFSSESFPTL